MNKIKIIITACITCALCSCQPSADLADTPICKMPGATDNPFLKNASVTVVFDTDAPQVIWPKILPTDDYSLPRRKIALKFSNELDNNTCSSSLTYFRTPIYYNKNQHLLSLDVDHSVMPIKLSRISVITFDFKNNDNSGVADITYLAAPSGLTGELKTVSNIPFTICENKYINPVDDVFFNKQVTQNSDRNTR